MGISLIVLKHLFPNEAPVQLHASPAEGFLFTGGTAGCDRSGPNGSKTTGLAGEPPVSWEVPRTKMSA